MQKIIFILCAIVCVYSASCQNNPKTSQAEEIVKEGAKNSNINVSKKQYVVNVPSGWQETDTSIQGLTAHIIFAPKDSSNFQSNLNIINENMQGSSFDDYKKAGLVKMQSFLPSFKELEQGDFETNSHVKAKWIHYSYTINGYNLESILYTIPIDGIAYMLTGASTVGNLDKYRNDFDAIAKSFHLK
jgi:hypothetical protein